jgi:hypothetical protein
VQVAPQLMPVGTEVTVPVPLPAGTMVRPTMLSTNVAVMVRAPCIVVTQVPVPEQPPPVQPAKFELPDGVAVSVTAVLFG